MVGVTVGRDDGVQRRERDVERGKVRLQRLDAGGNVHPGVDQGVAVAVADQVGADAAEGVAGYRHRQAPEAGRDLVGRPARRPLLGAARVGTMTVRAVIRRHRRAVYATAPSAAARGWRRRGRGDQVGDGRRLVQAARRPRSAARPARRRRDLRRQGADDGRVLGETEHELVAGGLQLVGRAVVEADRHARRQRRDARASRPRSRARRG